MGIEKQIHGVMKMEKSDRRTFIKGSGVAATAGLLLQTTGWTSPNDRINAGVVGIRGRGGDHVNGFAGQRDQGVFVTHLCDIDENVLHSRSESFKESGRVVDDVKLFTDYQEMLDDPELDVVGVATPNHWHSLQSIWACQKGKDVYVEKPLSHNLKEGRVLVEAARKHGRIVQHGTQIRSSAAIREAIEMLEDGVLGEVYYAKGLCYKRRASIGKRPVEPVPEGVHYDEFLGPAPQREFTQNRFHYNWHWHWDYGNGDIGNQGVHQMDVARWGLGVGLPDVAQCLGGHFMFDDDQETPNTQIASMKYKDENKLLVFEVRHWMTNDELMEGQRDNVGNIFLGSRGMMIMPSYTKYQIYFGNERELGPGRSEGGNHYANFFDAVRSRNHADLTADVEEGHLSSALCHIANAAYVVERTLQIDREKEEAIGDEEANDILQGRARGYRTPFELPAI